MRAPVTPDEPEPDPIDSYVEQALEELTAATDLDQLHAAHRRHTSAISPLAVARHRIGELPAGARTDAATRIADGFRRINELRDLGLQRIEAP